VSVRRVLNSSRFSSSTDARANLARLAGFVFLFGLGWVASGCKKPEPARPALAKIHAITRELATAAKSAAPSGSEIRVVFPGSDGSAGVTDHLDITLFSAGADSAARSQVAKSSSP